MPTSRGPIAVVEDDRSLAQALQRLLRAVGFEAETFESAEEFLASAAPLTYRCLVLDIQLPGMSGLDLYHHLAAAGEPAPVIFITGHADDAAREQAFRIPGSAYLRKPFPGSLFLEAVEAALRANEGNAPPEESPDPAATEGPLPQTKGDRKRRR